MPPHRWRALRTILPALAALLLVTVASVSAPVPARASTETSMEALLGAWTNRDRAALGLGPLRLDVRLVALAGERATWMADHGLMTHASVDGSLSDALTIRAIRWYSCGEAIGYTTYGWGPRAAASLYSLWRNSPEHWALLMSATYDYVGFGVAYDTATRTTYSSVAFLEGPDRTPPVSRMLSKHVSGTTAQFAWTGSDPLLQTHTAGLQGFNVQYRVDDGAWKQIRTGTTATSITLASRPRGHHNSIRVQARDRRGNLSAWTSGSRVWIP
jgi:uncharacterized protein YkwD